MIRITGGKFNRKQIKTIPKFVRPTSSLKREAFFSIIKSYGFKNSYNFFNKKTFLDLFAGIGTMGFEAISRGISNVIFYENNQEVVNILKMNCKNFCKQYQYEIIQEDIIKSNIEINFENISMIYIDPPYHKFNLNNLLKILEKKISKYTIIGIESSIKDDFNIPKKLKLLKQKKYGKSNLTLLILN